MTHNRDFLDMFCSMFNIYEFGFGMKSATRNYLVYIMLQKWLLAV